MGVTAVAMPILITVLNANAISKNLALLMFILQLEMDSATMKLTRLSVNMMGEIVVETSLKLNALNAHAIFKRLVLLDFFLYQLEMDSVMMKQTQMHAIMMEVTVVEM